MQETTQATQGATQETQETQDIQTQEITAPAEPENVQATEQPTQPEKAEEAPQAEQTQQEPPADSETMQELLDAHNVRFHPGARCEGTVISRNDAGFLVDVGFKCEGLLPMREYTNRSLIEEEGTEPKPGDAIKVEILSVRNGEEAQLLLSRWRVEYDRRWEVLEEAVKESPVMQVKGVSRVKGGLMVNAMGLEGFVPVSQLTLAGRGANPQNFVGQSLKVKVLDHDKKKHRLVFSRRVLLEEAENERKAKFYARVHEGDVLEGEVSSLTDFGVFVNLGEMDGLVHHTEITWKRSFKTKDMFKKGDKVTVKVIGIDQDKDRISLSMKQVSGNPWETVGERVHKGDIMKGVVTNTTDFGAFVEIEPGIEGLVHVGDISWTRIKKPAEVLKRNQEIEVLVLDVDLEKRRISLGYKQLNDPWSGIDQRYLPGQDIEVKVVRLADFGAFVEVEEGVEALIHISQLSRKRVDKPGDVLQEGQTVTARVLEVNPEQRRMRLSLSALEPEPEPAPEPVKEERAPGKPDFKAERPERGERGERRERRNRRGNRPVQERTGYEDDGEALEYNPFAEAFKGTDWPQE